MKLKQTMVRFLLFGFFGLVLEVFFTGIAQGIKGNWALRGHSSPWMMIDYSMLAIILPVSVYFKKRGIPLVCRAAIYMFFIFLAEFISGWIFDCAGIHIWDYSSKPYNLHGYITLTYVPYWFGVGLAAEKLNQLLDKCAWIILCQSTPGTLQDLLDKQDNTPY